MKNNEEKENHKNATGCNVVEVEEFLNYLKNDSGTVLYIRHGQTHFNKFSKDFSEEEAKVKIEFLDCPLSDTGKNQSSDLSTKVNEYKINYIFCSPLHRCLETCLLSLKNHPDKDKLKVIVHPLITETVNCIHDFSKRIFEKKNYFNKEKCGIDYDWSLFDSLHNNEVQQETYFVNYMDNLPEEDYAHDLINKIRDENHYKTKNHHLVENHLLELSNFAVERKKRPESLLNMFKRNLKFKNYLRTLEKSYHNEKILVYTHSCFIQISTLKEENLEDNGEYKIMEDFPKESYKPENCEILTMLI